MLKKQLLAILESETRAFFGAHKDALVDVILFGSVTHGKENPRDVDILLVFKEKIDLAYTQELRKKIQKKVGMPVEVTPKTYLQLFQKEFIAREGVLLGGYSLIHKIVLSEGLGYNAMVLFTYKLKGKTKSERMRFYYSLHGRKTEGMLRLLNARKYTETVVLCPLDNAQKMGDFFKSWSIECVEMPILIPTRLV